jgi:hypothetical protein
VDRKAASGRETLAVFAVFLLIFFFARLPLFSLGWDGQDASGSDADIFVHQPGKPNYLLFGRIHGQEIYVPALGHPAPMYEMYALLGKAVQWIIPFQTFSNQQIITLLKVIACLFQLAVWIPLLWWMLRNSERTARLVGCAIITALALSPLAIQGSNEFQLDSTFGFVMAGMYALALLFADRAERFPILGFLAIATASAFLGLGKNEWTIVAVAAWGALLIVRLAIRLARGPDEDHQHRRFLVCVSATILGLCAGNLASYLFEPTLYVSGLELIVRMVQGSSVASGADGSRFVEINMERLQFTQALLFVIAFMAWPAVLGRLPSSPGLMLASLFGLGLFLAFFLSTFAAFARYFAPALAALSVALVWLYVERPPRGAALVICTVASCWVAWTGIRHAHSYWLARSSIYGVRDIHPRPDCALLVPVEDGYRRKDLDFVHLGWGYQGAEKMASQFGGHVCPPD